MLKKIFPGIFAKIMFTKHDILKPIKHISEQTMLKNCCIRYIFTYFILEIYYTISSDHSPRFKNL